MIQQFRVGTAPNLIFYPPEGVLDGAATLTITEDSGTEVVAAESVTQAASPSTTLLAAAESGAESLSVASATGFVAGRRYLAKRANGIQFEVTARGVESGLITLNEGLPEALALGDGLRDWKLSRALTTTNTATVKRSLKALWVYAVGGEPKSYVQRFDIVREPFWFAITEADIRVKSPDWGDFKGRTQRWVPLIEGAHGDVDEIVRASGLYPDRLRDRDHLKSAVINALLARVHRSAGTQEESYRADMNADIAAALQQKNRYDTDDSGTDSVGDSDNIPAGGFIMALI